MLVCYIELELMQLSYARVSFVEFGNEQLSIVALLGKFDFGCR